MDIETLLRQHAAGFYDRVFDGYWNSEYAMTGYIVHQNEEPETWSTGCRVQGACHAHVNSYIARANSLAVITMPDRKLANNQGAIQFYDWLINKSFYSDVFLCKDPVLSLSHGFVKTTDVSAAKWLGAAQLARLSTSEFKKYMHAVYDVLASGFDIHPFFMMILATELGLMSDGKTVKATKVRRLDQLVNNGSFYSNNSSHLPVVYCEKVETIKELCEDNPNKQLWDPKYLPTFKQQRWPADSNAVASRLTKSSNGCNDDNVRAMLHSLNKGVPTLLFNIQEEVLEVPYLSLWEEAIADLKTFVYSKTNMKGTAEGVAINLAGVELFSKQYKLGE